MVSRRNKENDFREKWNHNAEYFRQNNVAADKKRNWESNTSFQSRFDFTCSQFETRGVLNMAAD